MSQRETHTVPTILFGAFDRHNFGDLLFPHIVAALLERDDLVFAGLAERDLRAFGGHEVHALAHLAAQYGNRKVNIVHAGGELLACNAWEAAVMLQPPGHVGYPAFQTAEGEAWARQTLGVTSLAPYTVPHELLPKAASIIYNAVGGMDLDKREPALRQEVLARLRTADAVGVRDRLTQALLRANGIDARLLPDCAVMVAELFGARIRAHAQGGNVARVQRAFPQGYVAVQFSADFGEEGTLAAVAAQLDRVAASSGLGIVFFRAGAAPWHDDLSCYRHVAARMQTPSCIVESLGLWDICAAIAGSRAYLGSSLHGRILAMAFALPRLNLRHPSHPVGATKPSAFADTWEAPGTTTVAAVHEIADALQEAMAVKRDTLAQTAARLVAEYRAGFAALCMALK